MRTKVVAALMISALASPAIAQSLPPLNLWRDKPAPSEEEVKREKAIDRAYKDTINQIPTKKTQDPWGNVRNAETKPGPKN